MLKIFYRKFYKCLRYRLEKSYFRHLAVTVIPFNSVDSIFQSSGGIESTLLDVGITVITLIRFVFNISGFLPQMASTALLDDHNKTFDNCFTVRQLFH